jgi:glycosyltransferase involved in cell wall biosynthesis
MANRQAKQGHDVTVLATNDEQISVDNNSFEHTMVLKKEWFKPFGARLAPSALYWLYKNINEYDIVHIHSHLYFTSNFVSLLNRVSSVPPVLITNHGTYATISPVISHLQFALFGIPTYNWAEITVCYNEIDRSILQATGVEDIRVIPNGIDIEKFSPRESRDVSSGPIVWSGRMVHRKGLLPTVRAMKYIVRDHPKIKLHVYGDGEKRREAEQLVADAEIQSNVEFKGYVKQEVLLEQLKKARLYLAPTAEYTFGRGIMEAISCGIPTFSTNLPTHEEIGVAGVPITRDPEEIANTINQYLSNHKSLEKVAQRGRNVMEQKHDFKTHIDRVTEIYQTVVRSEG